MDTPGCAAIPVMRVKHKALIIAEDGVDDFELMYAYHRLREECIEPLVASHSKHSEYAVVRDGRVEPAPRLLEGKHGTRIRVDLDYREALERLDEFDVLVLPGGRGPERARQHPEAVEIVRRMVEAGKPVIAICHGPQLLVSAGVVRGRRVTGYPGIRDDLVNAGAVYIDEPAVRDGNIVTVRHPTWLAEGFRLFIPLLRERGVGCG